MDKSELENMVYWLKKERDELQQQVWNLEGELRSTKRRLEELEQARSRAYDRHVTDGERRTNSEG